MSETKQHLRTFFDISIDGENQGRIIFELVSLINHERYIHGY